MKTRSFGRTGWHVGQIGIGTWQLGGTWGAIDAGEAVRTLHHAWERGVDFVDTAAAYGAGRSESLIGEALAAWRGRRPKIATKVTPPVWEEPIASDADFRGRFPAGHIRQSVEDSLRRLGVERIDLVQLHTWLPSGVTQLDWLEDLNALRAAGKVDRIGVSLRDLSPQEGVKLAQLGLADSIQAVLNLFEQEPAKELLPACASSGTAFIARVPLDSGALTGTWTAETWESWAPDDKRRVMYDRARFDTTLRKVEALASLARDHGVSLPELAMRYCLSVPGVSVVIPGMRSVAEVGLNLPLADTEPLPPELMARLSEHAWRHSFYGNTPPVPGAAT